jgi:hypothetical protein
MLRATLIAVVLGLCQSLAYPDQFCATTYPWVFPEDCGWERWTNDGGDERWFEDGALVLDGMASIYIADMYKQYLPSLPFVGQEILAVAWGLRVDQIYGFGDPGVIISVDRHGEIDLMYCANNKILSGGESEWIADYTPGVFQEYGFTTADLNSYVLTINGVAVHSGPIGPPMPDSYVAWGDSVQGAASKSTWSYVRIAVTRPGDVNTDGTVDFADINPFVQLLTESLEGGVSGSCAAGAADVNRDGTVNFADINPFIEVLTRG